MKKIVLALALVLASSILVVGLTIDANAGAHRDLMKQCKAVYKSHKKAGHTRKAT